MTTELTYTAADFELPPHARSGHCPKCGGVLLDTGVRITRPDGQVRTLVECTAADPDWHLASSHYEGTVRA